MRSSYKYIKLKPPYHSNQLRTNIYTSRKLFLVPASDLNYFPYRLRLQFFHKNRNTYKRDRKIADEESLLLHCVFQFPYIFLTQNISRKFDCMFRNSKQKKLDERKFFISFTWFRFLSSFCYTSMQMILLYLKEFNLVKLLLDFIRKHVLFRLEIFCNSPFDCMTWMNYINFMHVDGACKRI